MCSLQKQVYEVKNMIINLIYSFYNVNVSKHHIVPHKYVCMLTIPNPKCSKVQNFFVNTTQVENPTPDL
jgi:hypothetical protein